jgi:hypothetical protein
LLIDPQRFIHGGFYDHIDRVTKQTERYQVYFGYDQKVNGLKIRYAQDADHTKFPALLGFETNKMEKITWKDELKEG